MATSIGVVSGNVKVYFNLHKKVFSVQHKGLVIDHTDHLHMHNVQFRVSEAGRQRVIREKRKNVHAYVVAPVAEVRKAYLDTAQTDGWEAVTYNPYRDSTFVRRVDRSAVCDAYEAYLTVENGVPSMFIRTQK
jgi:hypothetical protein